MNPNQCPSIAGTLGLIKKELLRIRQTFFLYTTAVP